MAKKSNEVVKLTLPALVAQCFKKDGTIILPKVLAACADVLYAAREERYRLQNQAKILDELETKLEENFREKLPKGKASGISGAKAHVQLNPKTKPIVEDWDKFYAFVRKNNAFEMLQRRLNEGSANDYAEMNKRRVPGTNVMHYTDVSCTQVKR